MGVDFVLTFFLITFPFPPVHKFKGLSWVDVDGKDVDGTDGMAKDATFSCLSSKAAGEGIVIKILDISKSSK